MPAPADIRPSAMEAAPMREIDGSISAGSFNPSALNTRPDSVPTISGLRTSCPRKCWLLPRAMGQTAAILHSGTLTPISTERSEEHTSELQSPCNLVCRLLLEKKKKNTSHRTYSNCPRTSSDEWSVSVRPHPCQSCSSGRVVHALQSRSCNVSTPSTPAPSD